jgi:hypothetical protein
MNMTTSLDNIPLKMNDTNIDDKDDPMVKDILNEFQQELEINTRTQPPPVDNYQVNYTPPQRPIDYNIPKNVPVRKSQSFYNEDYIKKTAIIIIVVALIFSPIVFNIVMENIPIYISSNIEKFNYYFKLLISFLIIYIMFYYKLL